MIPELDPAVLKICYAFFLSLDTGGGATVIKPSTVKITNRPMRSLFDTTILLKDD